MGNKLRFRKYIWLLGGIIGAYLLITRYLPMAPIAWVLLTVLFLMALLPVLFLIF